MAAPIVSQFEQETALFASKGRYDCKRLQLAGAVHPLGKEWIEEPACARNGPDKRTWQTMRYI